MLQEVFNKDKLLIYQIGISPQFCSNIFTAQSTSSRLFATASLSSGDRQDVSCLYRCFRTEFFNAKEQLYASYKKKRKNTLENELKQKEIAMNSNYCLSYCASSSTLLWLSAIFSLPISNLAYGILHKQSLHWHLLKTQSFTAVLYWNNSNPHHLFNLFLPGALVILSTPVLFCYNLCSAVATKHLQL